jgi:ABC-2 type transport system ATP-binding protein
MPAIDVQNLHKSFRTKRKAAGFQGSFRSLWRPEWQIVEAVRAISFAMEEGELLGFIGPNGAGKSTTIKMLTGILYPTSGQATVLGYPPWSQRRELAYHIGLWATAPALVSPAGHGHLLSLRQDLRSG